MIDVNKPIATYYGQLVTAATQVIMGYYKEGPEFSGYSVSLIWDLEGNVLGALGVYPFGKGRKLEIHNIPETKSGWVNLYRGYVSDRISTGMAVFPSKEEALSQIYGDKLYLATVEITY